MGVLRSRIAERAPRFPAFIFKASDVRGRTYRCWVARDQRYRSRGWQRRLTDVASTGSHRHEAHFTVVHVETRRTRRSSTVDDMACGTVVRVPSCRGKERAPSQGRRESERTPRGARRAPRINTSRTRPRTQGVGFLEINEFNYVRSIRWEKKFLAHPRNRHLDEP